MCGRYLVRAVDSSDREARANMMWAATLAGIAFGNAGVHVPHGMSYAVAGLVDSFLPRRLPAGGADGSSRHVGHRERPAVFRRIAATSPERHLDAAELLGADVQDAEPGEAVSERIAEMMRRPDAERDLRSRLRPVRRRGADRGHDRPGRLLDNAPVPSTVSLAELFANSLTCW